MSAVLNEDKSGEIEVSLCTLEDFARTDES
jgi:hypothetical protein